MVRGFSLSLRRYILIALLVMGTVVISGFSVLAMMNFFAGMDGVMRGNMIAAAREIQVEPGKPKEVLSFIVAADWKDFPDSVKTKFNPDKLRPFHLHKAVERSFIFFRPSSAVFVVKISDRHGRYPDRYVAQVFDSLKLDDEPEFMISHEGWSMLLGLGVLVLFAGVLMILLRSVSRPVERLRLWAQGLNEQTLEQPVPEFKYQELNELAGIVHSSLQHVREGLVREREFVSHASHELRTPIAVIRSSVELLHKLEEKGPSKGANAIRRIDHASHTMTDLTETLLWLSRQDHDELAVSDIQPGGMLSALVQDLQYLLTGKQVNVELATDEAVCSISPTALRIVCGNLIRNAFQHTQSGTVTISQSGHTLTIVNREDDAEQCDDPAGNDELGYGLGLELVKRVTAKLGWTYQHRFTADGCEVSIVLNS